ncbi:MAG TPA: hypothetical protein VFY14_13585 [Streptomyces sp.]|nr:hypothetical protein [Streptomyces sp.]
MATTHHTPEAAPDDLFPIKEVPALLRETEYPASETTIRRWIDKHGIRTWLVRGSRRVSYSDVLTAQREEAIAAGIVL